MIPVVWRETPWSLALIRCALHLAVTVTKRENMTWDCGSLWYVIQWNVYFNMGFAVVCSINQRRPIHLLHRGVIDIQFSGHKLLSDSSWCCLDAFLFLAKCFQMAGACNYTNMTVFNYPSWLACGVVVLGPRFRLVGCKFILVIRFIHTK